MAGSTRVSSSTTHRKGYESLNDNVSDEDYAIIQGDLGSQGGNDVNEERRHSLDAHATQPSDDDSIEDDDDVELLPLNKQGRISSSRQDGRFSAKDTPFASSSTPRPEDISGEERDVGKAIEQVLEREHTMLSESFDTDVEDGRSHLVLGSDDSDDYGIPKDRGRRKPNDHGPRRWKSGLRSVLPLKAWWHVFPLVAVGLLMMWLAMKGLSWVRSKPAPDEYVSDSVLILTGTWLVLCIGASADLCRALYPGILLRLAGPVRRGTGVMRKRRIWSSV